MLDAERAHPRIVDQRAANPAGDKLFLQHGPMRARLRQQFRNRGFESCVHLVQRLFKGGGRIVDARMAHDGDEFVDARPRQTPPHPALGKLPDAGTGGLVSFRIGAVRVNQDVGVDGTQPPRPS